MNKTIKLFIISALLVAIHFLSKADTIYFTITNSVGNPDRTPIKITPVSSYQDASGVFYSRALPFWIYPNTNGFVATNLNYGYYVASNATIVSTLWPWQGGTSQGYAFQVVGSHSTYQFTQYPLSGYNVYNSVQGVLGVVLSGGFVGGVTNNILYLNGSGFSVVVSYSTITNALGYVPQNSALPYLASIGLTNGPSLFTNNVLWLNTSYDVLGAAYDATNLLGTAAWQNSTAFDQVGSAQKATNNIGIQSGLAAFCPTNQFDPAGKAQAATNGLGTAAFTSLTAYDSNGSAQAATNNIGRASGLSAFAPTNQFEPAGTALAATNRLGTAAYQASSVFDVSGAAQAATNGIGIPSGLAAFTRTNQYDSAGSAQASTNTLGTAAWHPVTDFDASGAAQAATNNLGISSGLSAFARTNQFDASGTAMKATNGLGSAAFQPSSAFDLAGSAQAATNGLAGTNYVDALTNGFTPIVFMQPSFYMPYSLLPGLTNQFYPIANPLGFITSAAISGFAPITTVSNMIKAGLQAATNNDTITSNGSVALVFSTALANSNNAAVLFTNSVNIGTSNLNVAVFGITNNPQHYIAATNGQASNLSIVSAMFLGAATNFNYLTNYIQVRGYNSGTYVGSPFRTTWTNASYTLLTFQLSGGFLFMQTNGVSLYQYPIINGVIQPGTVIGSAPTPVPFAAFDGQLIADGLHVDGAPDWPWLQTQIAGAAAHYVNGTSGINSTVTGLTNLLSLNTNYVVALILTYASSPTNGVSASIVTNIVLTYGGTLYEPALGSPPLTNGNGFFTNGNPSVPYVGGAYWFPTNSSGGGSGGNVYSNTSTVFNNVGISNLYSISGPNLGIGDALFGGNANNISIGVTSPVFISGQALYSSVSASGQSITNAGTDQFSIGGPSYNGGDGTLLFNGAGANVASFATGAAVFYTDDIRGGETSGGFMIGTNQNGGYQVNVIGSGNFSGGLFVNNIPVLTNASTASQTPWASDINADSLSLTNIANISGDVGANYPTLNASGGGWRMQANETGGRTDIGYIGANFNAPYFGGMCVLSTYGGYPVTLIPSFASDDGALFSDGNGNLTLLNLTNANIISSGTVSGLLASIGQATIGQTSVGNETASSVNSSLYLLNGNPIYFSTNATVSLVSARGLDTYLNGQYAYNSQWGYWTNVNGNTAAIVQNSPFLNGLCLITTNYTLFTNGFPVETFTNLFNTFYGYYKYLYGSSAPQFLGGVLVQPYTTSIPPPVTLTSSNASITIAQSSYPGGINFDLSAGASAGESVYFIANQSSTLPIATRPAICYTSKLGFFEKTNSTTDNSGWAQVTADQ